MAPQGTMNTEPPAPLLACENLWVRFSGVTALAGFSLEAQRGESLGIVGPNGSGKTTLLNAITGSIKPSSGKIAVFGHDITGLNPGARAVMGIARTHQPPRPFPGLTLTENALARVMFAATAPPPIDKGREVALEALRLVGLDHKAELRASSLTPAERTLLEIACAHAVKPRLLLLDEVCAGLAHGDREVVISLINEFLKLGTTILMVEHSMNTVKRLCSRVVALDRGVVIAAGPPEEVLAARAVKEAWLGIS
jgi:ABC-type branched-subunit amino acid transport system ATPase component